MPYLHGTWIVVPVQQLFNIGSIGTNNWVLNAATFSVEGHRSGTLLPDQRFLSQNGC
jgi:hypothetical protein